MAVTLRFYTRLFEISKERPNPINPIPGESILVWLLAKAKGTMELSGPECEDWGWYSSLQWDGHRYLIGASASDEEENGEREWVLQIARQRSWKDKLLGRAKMFREDGCAQYLLGLIQTEPAFRNVSLDP